MIYDFILTNIRIIFESTKFIQYYFLSSLLVLAPIPDFRLLPFRYHQIYRIEYNH